MRIVEVLDAEALFWAFFPDIRFAPHFSQILPDGYQHYPIRAIDGAFHPDWQSFSTLLRLTKAYSRKSGMFIRQFDPAIDTDGYLPAILILRE